MGNEGNTPVAVGEHSVHAVLDLPSRRLKAQKIVDVLGLSSGPTRMRVLEVGCGSGGIANYLGTLEGSPFEVDAVDVEDNRLIHAGYRFTQVSSVALPFADASFDVVISNHVIEHVGDTYAQVHHLREIRRVLRRGGAGYLAVPNRWQLIEPHFRLPFLSWLPERWRTPYLRAARRGELYDCRPVTRGELEALFGHGGLVHENACVHALRSMMAIEGRRWSMQRWLLGLVPDRVLWSLRSACPTHVYRFWRDEFADAQGGADLPPSPSSRQSVVESSNE